jgi:uncharacterized phage protein gp47/JayE
MAGLTLAELIAARTEDEMKTQCLAALQGVGFVTKASAGGTGSLAVSGVASGDYEVEVEVTTSGELGVAEITYSTDGGTVWSTPAAIPADGIVALTGTGAVMTFASGPTGAGTSFLDGDVYSFELSTPTLPVTAWQTASTGLTLVELIAQCHAELSRTISGIAAGGLLLYAEDDWLDLLAASVYGFEREEGTAAEGVVTLTNATASPVPIALGAVWVGTSGGLRYNNITSGTLPASSTLSVTVRAEAVGTAYNVANGAVGTLYTSLPGVTVSNSPVSGTWISVAGADRETDAVLRARCQARWPSLGTGATEEVYRLWAQTADASATRVTARASVATPGNLDILLASNAGGVSGATVTAVQAYVTARAPLCVVPVVASASAYSWGLTVTVYVEAGYGDAAETGVQAALQAYSLSVPIGGTIYYTAVIEALQSPDGVRNCVVTGMGPSGVGTPGDISLSSTQVSVIDVSTGVTVVEV